MVVLDQMKVELQNQRGTLDEVTAALSLDARKKRIEELSRAMEEPGFWDDADRANRQTREMKSNQDMVDRMEALHRQYDEIIDLIDLQNEEGTDDEEMAAEIRADLDSFTQTLEEIRISNLLNGPYDRNNAILRLGAGAGGTESCDWCSMLYRMYTRWAERKGFSVDLLDYQDGDEAGIKSVSFQVNGENAYGLLKSEHGVHRLVRISPFNAQGKRQTSFVSCDVMPDIEEDLDIQINDDDIRIDTYRSSGAGGQHINKTSSAIRITHFPTGIVVTCQNERSQFQNKDKAMQMLKAKLYMLKQEENEAKLGGIRGEVRKTDFGSQIRSYFLQPYTMVSDLRTGKKVSNADGVLDGDLDPFINAYLQWLANGGEPVGADEEDI
ncbi:MAG: peptide chain release factor 2 [Lachnospiraceae bacterium]|nr:peptide chain release factor 2 [Lachnospiraceae bacterium]